MRTLGLLVILLAGCGGGRYLPGGAVLVNGHARYLVFQEAGEHLLELDCEPPVSSARSVDCVAREVRFAAPAAVDRTLTRAQSEVIAAAAGCPASNITIQSGDEVAGFWIYACGTQRFYRRDAAGVWVDATPPP